MKKWQRIVGIIVVIIILSSSVVVWAFSSSVLDSDGDVGISYEQAVKDKRPFVIMFHAPWCSYCKKFMPTFKSLSTIYKDRYNFVMVNGDDAANFNLDREYAVGGFPTLYIIDPSIDNRVLLSNTLYGDVWSIRKELDRYLRVRALIK